MMDWLMVTRQSRLMMKGLQYIVLLVPVLFTLSGCRPKGILRSGEMRDVLVDLHKTDALLQMVGQQYTTPEDKAAYYGQILEKHGITQAQFDSSIVWYTAHPQLFDKIYPKVMAELHDEETRFRAENGILPTHEQELVIDQTGAPEFRKADLDSVLWVTRHGMPTHWQPLVHNLEDEFFPQIGVLR